ncbi:MAG: DUF1415 domain-containing protein [Bacteroidota bacterium]
MINREVIVGQTRRWLEKVVIGLQLCPFAKRPYELDRVRLVVLDAGLEEVWLEQMVEELQRLEEMPRTELETTLLIIPEGLESFHDYLDFLEVAELLNSKLGYEGEFQIASFHPNYQFAESPPHDLANFTNRSPFPMLHILREESVSRAVEHFSSVDQIPARNMALLRSFSPEKIQELFYDPS